MLAGYPALLSSNGAGVKRKHSGMLNALVLKSALAERLALPTNLGIAIRGPRNACKLLCTSEGGADQWLHKARTAAIAGSCPRSHNAVQSAVNAYIGFACKVLRFELPPSIDMLLAWSNLFRNSRTFQNYVCNMRTAMQLMDLESSGMHSSLLKKACRAIDKRQGFKPRGTMFIGSAMVVQLVQHASVSMNAHAKALAMAFLASYVFLLRLPSECLPISVASNCAGDAVKHAVIAVHPDCIMLTLKRRKNKEGGSVLKRTCWCKACTLTCPVHVLGKYFLECGAGCHPFKLLDARSVLGTLRTWLQTLHIKDAAKYRTHDLRRGHARDLQLRGASLWQILQAGEWRSPAFLAYMDKTELECGAASECRLDDCLDDSSDDEPESV